MANVSDLFTLCSDAKFSLLFVCFFSEIIWVKRRQCKQLFVCCFYVRVCVVVFLWACISIFYCVSLSYWLNICCICVYTNGYNWGGEGFHQTVCLLLLITEVILLFHLLICLCLCMCIWKWFAPFLSCSTKRDWTCNFLLLFLNRKKTSLIIRRDEFICFLTPIYSNTACLFCCCNCNKS